MRRGRTITLALLCFLCGMAAAASAADRDDLSNLEVLSFEVKVGHGLSVAVLSGDEGSSTVAVREKGKNGLITSAYSVPGDFSRHGLKANFGSLGAVDMTFQPSGGGPIEKGPRRRPGAKVCSQVFKVVPGVFSGSFAFRNEDGSVDIERRHAHGELSLGGDSHCRGPDSSGTSRPGHPTGAAEAALVATDCEATSVSVSGPSAGAARARAIFSPGGLLFAARRESRSRISIVRSAILFDIGSSLSFAADYNSATLAPPPPFSGSAVYRRDPQTGVASWTGDLSIAFPGKNVALTGAAMRSKLKPLERGEGLLGILEATLLEESLCEEKQ